MFREPHHLENNIKKYQDIISYLKYKHPDLEEGLIENIVDDLDLHPTIIYKLWDYVLEKYYLSDENKIEMFSSKARKEIDKKTMERVKKIFEKNINEGSTSKK